MSIAFRLSGFVFGLLLATPLLLALAGCGGQSASDSVAEDPATQSVSKYEAEIAKSKAAAPGKAAK